MICPIRVSRRVQPDRGYDPLQPACGVRLDADGWLFRIRDSGLISGLFHLPPMAPRRGAGSKRGPNAGQTRAKRGPNEGQTRCCAGWIPRDGVAWAKPLSLAALLRRRPAPPRTCRPAPHLPCPAPHMPSRPAHAVPPRPAHAVPHMPCGPSSWCPCLPRAACCSQSDAMPDPCHVRSFTYR